MQILGVDIEFQMLITEAQTSETQNHGLLDSCRPTGHEPMTFLVLECYQPSFCDRIYTLDFASVFPQLRCFPNEEIKES